LAAEAWADGLVRDGQGLWPSFDVPVMIETLRQAVSRSYWEEWKSIQCPTLLVRAQDGVIHRNEMEMMDDLLPQGCGSPAAWSQTRSSLGPA
jgi:pimeloyl-ACP methyl ester carboxylesterase